MNRLRLLLIGAAIIIGSSALASAQGFPYQGYSEHDRGRHTGWYRGRGHDRNWNRDDDDRRVRGDRRDPRYHDRYDRGGYGSYSNYGYDDWRWRRDDYRYRHNRHHRDWDRDGD